MSDISIIRIMSVLDTRQYVEDGDRWIPVPGSGAPRPCDRCQSIHEVHVEVELSDHSTAVIGSGCARTPFYDASIRRLMTREVRRASTLRSLWSALAAANVMWARGRRIDALAADLPVPQIIESDARTAQFPTAYRVRFACGDFSAHSLDPDMDERQREVARAGWRANRAREMNDGHLTNTQDWLRRVRDLEAKITKVERRHDSE